jgi:3-phenylpropionate/trans-cinnamate dioxygenase ferredoxin subunit
MTGAGYRQVAVVSLTYAYDGAQVRPELCPCFFEFCPCGESNGLGVEFLAIDSRLTARISHGGSAMAQFVKVGSRTEFEDLEGGKLVEAGGHRIAVFNVGGRYYAIENTCPHRGGPLAEGMVVGEEVICPWHGSRFNVKTGLVLTPPARQGVESFPVRVTGDDVEVEVDL